jgi:hypothetical protein
MKSGPPKLVPDDSDQGSLQVLRMLTGRPDAIVITLHRSLLAGMRKVESAIDLTDRIQASISIDRMQAHSIAENFMAFIFSRNSWERLHGIGLGKTWLCGPQCKIPGHPAACKKYRDPIPLDEPFIVNGVPLMYPRDFLSGHIDQCRDCQCLLIGKRMPQSR